MLSVVLAACGSSATEPGDGAVDATQAPALSADEAAKACAVYGSCMGDGINDCYTDAMPYWAISEARCALAATGDCAAVRACFGMMVVADASCTTRVTSCDGTNLVTCGSGVRSTVACPKASLVLGVGSGPTCVPASNGSALCGTQACSAASASCAGSVATSCNLTKGVEHSLDCAVRGQSCLNGACTASGGGAACTAGTLPRCEGALIVHCSSGTELTTDCGTIAAAATCHVGTATTELEPYCGGAACYPTKGSETCNGNAVAFCAGGTTASIDCTTLGFSSCVGGKCF